MYKDLDSKVLGCLKEAGCLKEGENSTALVKQRDQQLPTVEHNCQDLAIYILMTIFVVSGTKINGPNKSVQSAYELIFYRGHSENVPLEFGGTRSGSKSMANQVICHCI